MSPCKSIAPRMRCSSPSGTRPEPRTFLLSPSRRWAYNHFLRPTCSERVSMPLDWSPFVDLTRRHQRFVLTTHVRPDGDGLGSMLALADALKHQGKTVKMAVASALPSRYDFMDPARSVQRF